MLKNTVKKYYSEGSKINQFVLAALMVVPVFSYGTAVGWISPMGPLLMSEDTPGSAPVGAEIVSWMASAPYLVGTPAVFLFGYIVDRFGRKKALMFTSFSMAMCWSLKLFSKEPWALITARAIVGLGVSGSYVVTPLYIKEISDDSIRGTLGSLVILSQNMGNLLVYILGEYLNYHPILWICLAIPLIHLLVFTAMPDTPSYLMKCGRVEEARDTLAWLLCKENSDEAVDNGLQRLLLELERDKTAQMGNALKTLYTDKPTFHAFRITVIITAGRELCGCIAVLHFASLIFGAASDGSWVLSANQQAAILGLVQLIGSFTASTLVEKTGRKMLLGTTCLVSGLSMMVLGTWFFINSGSAGAAGCSWLPVAALCLCIYCDAAGLQPVPFIIMSEMFSYQMRSTVTSITIAMVCILVSAELRMFQPVASSVGMHTAFWTFAVVCLGSAFYVFICVPETKKRSLEEIYAELEGKRKKKHINQTNECDAVVTRL